MRICKFCVTAQGCIAYEPLDTLHASVPSSIQQGRVLRPNCFRPNLSSFIRPIRSLLPVNRQALIVLWFHRNLDTTLFYKIVQGNSCSSALDNDFQCAGTAETDRVQEICFIETEEFRIVFLISFDTVLRVLLSPSNQELQ